MQSFFRIGRNRDSDNGFTSFLMEQNDVILSCVNIKCKGQPWGMRLRFYEGNIRNFSDRYRVCRKPGRKGILQTTDQKKELKNQKI